MNTLESVCSKVEQEVVKNSHVNLNTSSATSTVDGSTFLRHTLNRSNTVVVPVTATRPAGASARQVTSSKASSLQVSGGKISVEDVNEQQISIQTPSSRASVIGYQSQLQLKPKQGSLDPNILSISCIRCNRTYSTMKDCNAGVLQCTFCRWTFESPCHLRCHVDHFHSSDDKCPACDFVLRKGGIAVMDTHFKTVHPGHKFFHCYLCEMEFSTKAVLRSHVMRHFNSKGDFECPHCHMRQDSEVRVNTHIVKSHAILMNMPHGPHLADDQTSYMCGVCGKNYRYAGSLTLHLREHQKQNEEPPV